MSTNVDSLPATDASLTHSLHLYPPSTKHVRTNHPTTKINITGTSKNKGVRGSATGLHPSAFENDTFLLLQNLPLCSLFLLFFPVAYSVINMGYLVEIAATQTPGKGVSYAQRVTSLDAGNIAPFGCPRFIGAVNVAVAFFAPFTGTSTLSLISSDDLLSVRPNQTPVLGSSVINAKFRYRTVALCHPDNACDKSYHT